MLKYSVISCPKISRRPYLFYLYNNTSCDNVEHDIYLICIWTFITPIIMLLKSVLVNRRSTIFTLLYPLFTVEYVSSCFLALIWCLCYELVVQNKYCFDKGDDDDGYNNITYLDILSLNNKNASTFVSLFVSCKGSKKRTWESNKKGQFKRVGITICNWQNILSENESWCDHEYINVFWCWLIIGPS